MRLVPPGLFRRPSPAARLFVCSRHYTRRPRSAKHRLAVSDTPLHPDSRGGRLRLSAVRSLPAVGRLCGVVRGDARTRLLFHL